MRMPRPQNSSIRSDEKETPRDPTTISCIRSRGTWAQTAYPSYDDPLALLAEEQAKPGNQQLCAILRGKQRYRAVFRKDCVILGWQVEWKLLGDDFVFPGDPVQLRARWRLARYCIRYSQRGFGQGLPPPIVICIYKALPSRWGAIVERAAMAEIRLG